MMSVVSNDGGYSPVQPRDGRAGRVRDGLGKLEPAFVAAARRDRSALP